MTTTPRTFTITEAAILTPIGQGGIAVVRVIGPRALDLAKELFRPKRPLPDGLDGSRIHYGHIVDGGEVVDEVLVRMRPAGEAPGGQPTVEVNCHGGIVAVQRVLDCFVARGAQAVEPETLLATEARSVIQAEAAQALLRASTPLGADTLLDQLDGALEAALASLPWDQPQAAKDALERLLDTERLGRSLWQPPTVALVGPTNAGKSTLFNALAREERVIVSPMPGTTRDSVSAEVAIGGLPVWLVDTAGQREAESAIEREAIERARAAAAAADLALLVLDASDAVPAALSQFQGVLPKASLVVLNKSDLGLAPWAKAMPDAVVCSATTGEGVGTLGERVVQELVGEARYETGRPVVFTERQGRVLRAALERLNAGAAGGAKIIRAVQEETHHE